MLRLTLQTNGHPQPAIRAEGRLVGDWVSLLEVECARVLDEAGGLDLDLGGVSDVDARGLEALRRLRRGSITLIGCTPLMLALLAEENQS